MLPVLSAAAKAGSDKAANAIALSADRRFIKPFMIYPFNYKLVTAESRLSGLLEAPCWFLFCLGDMAALSHPPLAPATLAGQRFYLVNEAISVRPLAATKAGLS